jgi:trigger factor
MNIVRKDIDALNAQLIVQITSSDYAEKVEKSLKDYKRKANIPGFRPGMVPIGLLKKMYGKAIIAEEVNKVVSDALNGYIRDNNLNLLGEILPNETEQAPIDFDSNETFELLFDFAVAPEIEVSLSKDDSIVYYDIEVEEKLVDDQIKSLQDRLSSNVDAEMVEEKDLVKGTLTEVNDLEAKLSVTDAVLTPSLMTPEQKAHFIGKKVGDVITFNPSAAFTNETEIASLLKISKDEIQNFKSDFTFTIENVSRYQLHPLDQELFDLIYGKDIVTTEAEARDKEREALKAIMEENSFYRFEEEARHYLIKKLSDVTFPETFLKRWLLETNEKVTEEIIEKEFSDMLDTLRWQLTRNKLAEKNEIKVGQEDLEAYAIRAIKAQYAQYGITNFPEDLLVDYAKDTLKKEGQTEKYIERVLDEKVIGIVKNEVSLEIIPITLNDFHALLRF